MAETPEQKPIVIAGAGPAGLTAAAEVLRHPGLPAPVVFEATDAIGGISQTVCHGGNRLDIGGHRIFTKSERVGAFLRAVMPEEGSGGDDTKDDAAGNAVDSAAAAGTGSADPDRVMLRRRRISRIYYLRRFFDYPVTLSRRTLANMGLWRTLKAGAGFLAAKVRPRRESSLEDFYINRFGAPLYHMFFEDYTRKVWGRHPSRLGADWGNQRVKGLSLSGVVKDMLRRRRGRKAAKVETSLIDEFLYPKYGPGQLWEAVAHDVSEAGGRIRMQTKVEKVHVDAGRRIEAVTVRHTDGTAERVECSALFSSMPLKELAAAIDGIDVPEDVAAVAAGLPYRDFITVGLLVDSLAITNDTKIPTPDDRIPDTWIYIQERDVKLGRLQVFNNWSPYMVADPANSMWLGLEYFCDEGDEMWEMSDEEFIAMAVSEMEKIGMLRPGAVRDAVRIKMPKAYPAYFGTYDRLDILRRWLDTIPNLYCVGRNGQHRYNNMDHSMLTSMLAVDALAAGSADRSAVWNVNTEDDYHEERSK